MDIVESESMNLVRKYLAMCQDESLEEHDRHYHGGDFDPKTMECGKRDNMAKEDEGDKVVPDKMSDEELDEFIGGLLHRGRRKGDVLGEGGWKGVNFSQWDRDSYREEALQEKQTRIKKRMEEEAEERRRTRTMTEVGMLAALAHIYANVKPDYYDDDDNEIDYGTLDPVEADVDTVLKQPNVSDKVLKELAIYESPGGFDHTDDDRISLEILRHPNASEDTKKGIVRNWTLENEPWYSERIAEEARKLGYLEKEEENT